MCGLLDFNRIDTTPGATGCHAFLAPPEQFNGGIREYMLWLRDRYDNDLAIRQYLLSAAIFQKIGTPQSTAVIVGPFAEGLARVLQRLREGFKNPEAQPLKLAS